MPPASLSPSGRARSRTSDISDFLRGRHDNKTSTDLQSPPPVLQPAGEPITPPKSKSKFAFLGRKRKSSFTPTKAGAAAAASTAVAVAASSGSRRENASDGIPPVPRVNQPSSAGPSGRGNSRELPPLPPLSVIAPGYRPPGSDPAGPDPPSHSNSNIPHYNPQFTAQQNRKLKGSFESTRRSTDSRSSTRARPIITVSPPHNTIHDSADAYTAPRSAPSPEKSNTSLPTPTSSDRTATPDSPSSVNIPSPSTSATSVATNLPHVSPTDAPLAAATSYKEETLLRKDHFEIGGSETQPRRGTVSFNKSNQQTPATVGFSPSRHERRHISVTQLNRLRKEIVASAPKVRKVPSDSSFLADHNAQRSSALARSNTISTTPPQTPQQLAGSRSPTPQGRKLPPPLKRTWHSPPTTGPPKEPLPSPPSEVRNAPTSASADSFCTAPSPSSSPVSPRRTLPSLVTLKERSPSRTQGPKSPDSLMSVSIPSSPTRSDADAPSTRTPVREDPAKKVLADADATAEELREALRVQSEKYSRLSAYLLSLTERHALEKAELMRKVDVLEQNAAKCEHEMKGLRWIVANSGKSSPAPTPTRADSNTLPGKKPPRDRSSSGATTRSAVGSNRSVKSIRSEDRTSFDSPAGSVEEGLAELQSTISEFIAPLGSPSTDIQTQQQPSIRESALPGSSTAGRTRARRSNTVPNVLSSGIPKVSSPSPAQLTLTKQKQVRRTSSPLIPSPAVASSSSSSSPTSPPSKHTQARNGLGLRLGQDGSPSPPSLSRSSTPDSRDLHARCDSSTLSTLSSLSTFASSSSGLSSIPETPRTDVEQLPTLDEEGARKPSPSSRPKRLSTSSVSSAGSSRVSASPSIAQVLDRSRKGSSTRPHHAPEMDAILRRLRQFGGHHSS